MSTKTNKPNFNKRYKKYPKGIKRKYRKALPLAMPDKYMCRLRYATTITLDPANAGTAVSHIFVANSLYDPDSTGVGHQYNGYDQLCVFYDHCQVLSSTIMMSPFQYTQTGVNPFAYGIALTDNGDSTAGQSLSYILEQDFQKKAIRSAGIVNANTGHGGPKQLTATMRYSQKKFFGVKGLDDQFQHSAGGNPTEMAYFECWGCGSSGTEAGEMTFIVQIEAIAIFLETKPVPQS